MFSNPTEEDTEKMQREEQDAELNVSSEIEETSLREKKPSRRKTINALEPSEVESKKDLILKALQESTKKAKQIKSLAKKSFRPLLVIKDEILLSWEEGADMKDVADSLSSILEARITVVLLKDFILEYATPEQIKPRTKELDSARKRKKKNK